MFRRLSVYLRTGFVASVAAAVVVVLFMNRHNEIRFWFFGLTDASRPFNVVWLVLSTASATLLISRVVALGFRLWKDWRGLRSEQAMLLATKTQKLRVAELEERERRLDEKLKSAMNEGQEGLGNSETAGR